MRDVVRIVSKDDNRIVLRNLVGASFSVPLNACEELAHKLLMADKIVNEDLGWEHHRCLAGKASTSLVKQKAPETRYVGSERVKEVEVGTRIKIISVIGLGLDSSLYEQGEILKVVRPYGNMGWVIEGESYLLKGELENPQLCRILRSGEY